MPPLHFHSAARLHATHVVRVMHNPCTVASRKKIASVHLMPIITTLPGKACHWTCSCAGLQTLRLMALTLMCHRPSATTLAWWSRELSAMRDPDMLLPRCSETAGYVWAQATRSCDPHPPWGHVSPAGSRLVPLAVYRHVIAAWLLSKC